MAHLPEKGNLFSHCICTSLTSDNKTNYTFIARVEELPKYFRDYLESAGKDHLVAMLQKMRFLIVQKPDTFPLAFDNS